VSVKQREAVAALQKRLRVEGRAAEPEQFKTVSTIVKQAGSGLGQTILKSFKAVGLVLYTPMHGTCSTLAKRKQMVLSTRQQERCKCGQTVVEPGQTLLVNFYASLGQVL
jgi:hypothetical protein